MVFARLNDVSFTFAYSERPALQHISLTLAEGLLYGVVGTNGSGKTTLCQLLRGIVPFFHDGELEGDVEVLGKPLLEWEESALATSIGCVFENPFTQISGIKETVFEEIAFGLENLGFERDEIFRRVEETLDELDLWKLAHKNPNDLSGGQRQKVAFGSIIAMDSPAIVIDEPTSQLDPEATEMIFDAIERLKSRGKTVILAEHKIDHLARVADRLIVLHDGQLVQEGAVRDVLTGPELAGAQVPTSEIVAVSRGLLQEPPLTRDEFHARLRDGEATA